MIFKFIDILFGPLSGWLKLLRRSLKLIIFGALGFFVHILTLSIFLNFDETKVAQLQFLQSEITELGEIKNSFVFEFCMSGKYSGSVDIPECTFEEDIFRDVVLGFNLSENGNVARSEVILAHMPLLSHSRLLPNGIVDNPKIVHSQHSLSRSIERIAFNDTNQRTSAVRLCEGTARKLDDDICQATNSLRVTGLDPLIGNYFSGTFRIFTLLFGDIQWMTISLFLFGCSEVFGRYLRWVVPQSRLFSEASDQGGAKLKTLPDLEASFEKYSAHRVRSIPDRLFERAAKTEGLFDPASEGLTPERDATKGETTLEGFRDFLDAEAEANMDSLHTTNELVLKLAFAGTIWGIGSALFSARELDVADPVVEVLAKADMFGSIGTAFGTTLLGVMLSAVLSVFLQSLSSSWKQRINLSYASVLSLRDKIRGMKLDPSVKPIPPIPRPPIDFLVILGALVVVLIFGIVSYLVWIL